MTGPRAASAIARLAQVAALGLVGLVGGGCGYELRGTGGLPSDLHDVHLTVQSSGLYYGMTELLESSGARLVGAENAQLRILVDQEDLNERLLSVDPNTGSAREYELAYSAVFSVLDPAGKVVVPRQVVRIVRDYVFDADAVIGKSRERWELLAEMHRDAALQIFNRIRAAYLTNG